MEDFTMRTETLKRINYLATIRDFLGFSLNMNAEDYGYKIDHDATWEMHKRYIRAIFEAEYGIRMKYVKMEYLKCLFIDWLNYIHCIVNVFANYDYCDKYALNNMLPVGMRKKRISDEDKVNFINEKIFELIFG